MNKTTGYLNGHTISKLDTAYIIINEVRENSMVISGKDKIDMLEVLSLLDKIEKRLESSFSTNQQEQ